jgi:SAM-dependent methyltransferase
MTDSDASRLGPALAESSGWALATQQAAVVRGALSSGFLARCREPVTIAELAAATGLGDSRIHHLCSALVDAKALLSDGAGRVRVTPLYAPLLGNGADRAAIGGLEGAVVRARLLASLFTAAEHEEYGQLPSEDRVALAASVTVDPATGFARDALRALVDRTPARRAALEKGGRHLELGCGLGGAMLTMLQLYPSMTAVGVDLAADLLDLARQKAQLVGVADRVDFIEMDAGAYSDPEPFDFVFWSQYFFPAPTRKKALTNAYERLRPGGTLTVPLLVPAEERLVTPQLTLDTLLVESWGVPARTPAELVAEVEEAGFDQVAVHTGATQSGVTAIRP